MNNLSFKLDVVGHRTNQRLSVRTLNVYIDDKVIWPVAGEETREFEIQTDDLLSHLVEGWKPLMVRQTYPLDLSPNRPSTLVFTAEERWSDLPESQVEAEAEVIENFIDIHDISRAFAGLYDLPALWLVHSGNDMIIEANGFTCSTSFGAAFDALTELGQTIADTLRKDDKQRWSRLLEAWDRRDVGDAIGLTTWATNLPEDTVRQFVGEGLFDPVETVTEAANDNDEVRLAARMASSLPAEDIASILRRLKAIPHQPSEALASASSEMIDYFETELRDKRPFDQGELAARFARSLLGLPGSGHIDVSEIYFQLKVPVIADSIKPETLDALAVWGSKHGPASFVNLASERHADAKLDSHQVRTTLAHELCHLLLDSEHSVSAVEVLGNKMPKAIEQRAKAFAGEFLLPTADAEAFWLRAKHPTDLENLNAILTDLADSYNVSRSVASWKLQHAAKRHDVNLDMVLDKLASHR